MYYLHGLVHTDSLALSLTHTLQGLHNETFSKLIVLTLRIISFSGVSSKYHMNAVFYDDI